MELFNFSPYRSCLHWCKLLIIAIMWTEKRKTTLTIMGNFIIHEHKCVHLLKQCNYLTSHPTGAG